MFTSTRNKNINIHASAAIKQGISNEGGLFVPTEFKNVSMEKIAELCKEDYKGRAAYILGLVLDDFTQEEVKSCVENAYTKEKFGDSPAPLKKIDSSAFALELWHGPTCAFKDMALQILPHLTTCSLKKTGEDKTVLILVATSGDTGKAALEGFADVEGTKILVFYPTDGVSNIQKLQMTTQDGKNVAVCGIYGNFDDAQNGVKAIFTDNKVKEILANKGYIFSSANSINWGRLAPQIVYYFSAYCDLINQGEIKLGEKINITVPTGNFGNILAAYYAMKMGLPVNKFICASNKNNILTDFIESGVYDKNRSFFTTVSPSMDILISSNLERLLFDLCDCDDVKLNALMSSLKNEGKYTIDNDMLEKLQALFVGGYCDDIGTKECINKTFNDFGYVIDTHTAVAVKVYNEYRQKTNDTTKTVIASTASPFKFNEAVIEALTGEKTDGQNEFELLDRLSSLGNIEAPKALTQLKTKNIRFKDTCKKEDMLSAVNNIL